MDNEKLYKALIEDEDVKDIPMIFIIRVACCVLKLIDEGDCFKMKGVYYE